MSIRAVLRTVLLLALAPGLGISLPASLEAQIGGAIRRAAEQAAARTVDPSRLLEGTPPISTSLADAAWAVDSLDNFSPHDVSPLNARRRAGGVPAADSLENMPLRSMLDLQRTPNGGFVLQPGFYEMHTQSYCLHAGTHGPGRGDGYLYAPPAGSADDAVVAILRNSVAHPDIPQSAIQQLLWAIVARSKFEDLNPQLKATAARLLTPSELASLNRNALDLIPDAALERAIQNMPALVQQAFRAEAQLRQMLTSANTSFDQMERVAVLAGLAPVGPGSRDVPEGRWSRHPDGYFVRYMPRAYSYTVTQIWVPSGSQAVGKEYDPATHIAVPGNTAKQRLIQSGRARTE
jgi:hypothetical protein